MKKTKSLPKTIPFKNNKGDIIHIPENYKIEDLLRMGITEIKFMKKGSFVPNGWYVNTPEPKTHETTKPVRHRK